MNLPFWDLGNNFYLIDDRSIDYDSLKAEALNTEGTITMMAASAPPTPPGTGGTNSVPAPQYQGLQYTNGLRFLKPTVIGNTVYLTLTGAPTNYGSALVLGDLLMSTNVAAPLSTWNWLGVGCTSNSYTVNGQPANMAFYVLAKPSKTMIAPWGDDSYGQCDVPSSIASAVQVTAGIEFSLALLNNGTVVEWGFNGASGLVPTGLSGVKMIASGWDHNVALLNNGTVTAWGDNFWGELNVPAGLANVVAITAGGDHSLALKSDGTVVAWGYNGSGESTVPGGLTNVSAIAAGGRHSLAVSNGSVVGWGYNVDGECNVPSGLGNVVAVAAGWSHSMALKSDGTVVCWGNNSWGQCNVPANLNHVVAIAADNSEGNPFSVALKSDGTVVAWGAADVTAPLCGMNNVIAIGVGAYHALAIRTGPPTPVITVSPTDQYQIAGGSATFNARGIGLYGVTYQWQHNGVNISGANGPSLTLVNVQTAQQGIYHVVVTGNNGTGTITSSDARFYLVSPPVITSQLPTPGNQVVPYKTNLTLSVAATAPGQFNGFPLAYQWRFNGTNISGANSNSYSFWVDTPTLGAYSVVVSNVAGSVTSQVWQVSMTYTGSYIAPGTLAYYLSTNLVAYTNGITDITKATTLFTNWTYGIYTSASATAFQTNLHAGWSPNFWLKGVQGLSATSMTISNNGYGTNIDGSTNYCSGTAFMVTMVSPRHYLRASHTGQPGMVLSGGVLAFLDTNNVIYYRTCKEQVDIDSDTSIGILDSDLPPSVGFLPILPTNYWCYLPTNAVSYIQGLGMNQDGRVFGQPITLADTYPTLPWFDWSSSAIAPFGLTTNWNVTIRGGDSSDPEMLLINKQLVLVSHNWHPTSGPNYGYQIVAINQQMHYLSIHNSTGTDYQLSQFSLTSWPVINH